MSAPSRRFHFRIEPERYAEIEREAARTGQSVADVIREAVATYLSARATDRRAAPTDTERCG